jgi:hypothetical protein
MGTVILGCGEQLVRNDAGQHDHFSDTERTTGKTPMRFPSLLSPSSRRRHPSSGVDAMVGV